MRLLGWPRQNRTPPSVTIICLTYNHAPYIGEALQSFISQQDIDFEVIVADDASTDGTTEIVAGFAAKYPDIVRHIHQSRNVGVEANFTNACQFVRGEFVAICDGDDYFITRDKIKKQVDILQSDQSLSICFSYARMVYEQNPEMERLIPSPEMIGDNRRFNLRSLREVNLIPTCTVMYRWLFRENLAEISVQRGILPGDYFLHLLHAKSGDIAFLNEVTAVYRRHSSGMWWQYDRDWDSQNLKHGMAELRFHLTVSREIFAGDDREWYEKNRVMPFMALLMALFLRKGDLELVREIQKIAPEFFENAARKLELR
jgi:glycosyltransferase involved in cell wall biosynthesis